MQLTNGKFKTTQLNGPYLQPETSFLPLDFAMFNQFLLAWEPDKHEKLCCTCSDIWMLSHLNSFFSGSWPCGANQCLRVWCADFTLWLWLMQRTQHHLFVQLCTVLNQNALSSGSAGCVKGSWQSQSKEIIRLHLFMSWTTGCLRGATECGSFHLIIGGDSKREVFWQGFILGGHLRYSQIYCCKMKWKLIISVFTR